MNQNPPISASSAQLTSRMGSSFASSSASCWRLASSQRRLFSADHCSYVMPSHQFLFMLTSCGLVAARFYSASASPSPMSCFQTIPVLSTSAASRMST